MCSEFLRKSTAFPLFVFILTSGFLYSEAEDASFLSKWCYLTLRLEISSEKWGEESLCISSVEWGLTMFLSNFFFWQFLKCEWYWKGSWFQDDVIQVHVFLSLNSTPLPVYYESSVLLLVHYRWAVLFTSGVQALGIALVNRCWVSVDELFLRAPSTNRAL